MKQVGEHGNDVVSVGARSDVGGSGNTHSFPSCSVQPVAHTLFADTHRLWRCLQRLLWKKCVILFFR